MYYIFFILLHLYKVIKFCFCCVVYETCYYCVLEHNPVVQHFVPAHIVTRRLAITLYIACVTAVVDNCIDSFWGDQTSAFKREEIRHLALFWRPPGISIMVGFHVCVVSLILLLALAGGLGSVYELGEDLDRPLFGPPGSPIWLHESDPGLQKALNFAEERYNRGSNAMHLRKVSRLISATRQVRLLHNTYSHVFTLIYISARLCHNKPPLLNTLDIWKRMYATWFCKQPRELCQVKTA